MTDWLRRLDGIVGEIGAAASGAARAVRTALGADPFELVAYHGFGTAERAYVYGRALEHTGATPAGESDSVMRNLVNSYRRAAVDPLPRARVAVTVAGRATAMQADDEGFFTGWAAAGAEASSGEWRPVGLELLEPRRAGEAAATGKGEVLVPPPSARFGVISDLDDTVIQSRVSNFLLAARTVILGNARTRLPFPGVAAFYTALRNGAGGDERNPIFYVSSSPWNIHDVIAEFMALQNVPKGPILLRDWDISLGANSATRHFDHKGVAIRRILDTYPALPFILIGDTTQHDPEIYRGIVAEYPDRIRAIYIRDVTRNAVRAAAVQALAAEIVAARSVLVLAEDTVGVAAHAVEHGWIAAESLAAVREENRDDEGKTDAKEATPGGGEQGTDAPPTVVE